MENLSTKITIITVCYNCRSDLELTVKSVLSQSFRDKEYVIVDGGSTDGSLEMLNNYKDKISVLISEPDQGVYDAMNKGVKVAKGEWIICLNAGDTFASASTLSDVFKAEIPECKSVIYSNFVLNYPNGVQTLRTTSREDGEIHHQNIIYRRSLHHQYGYYIVTHPYIISDLLFFLAIPAEKYIKIPFIISYVKAGGISDSQWCTEQAWAAKIIYGMDNIPGIFFKYLCARTHLFFMNVKSKMWLWRKK